MESAWRRIGSRLTRRKRQLKAEARLLGAEVVQIGVQIWDKIDDLPFVPASFKLSPVKTQFYGHGAFMGAAPLYKVAITNVLAPHDHRGQRGSRHAVRDGQDRAVTRPVA